LHLADLDPERAADRLAWEVYCRAKRDALGLGFAFLAPSGTEKLSLSVVLAQSKIYGLVRVCAEWAKSGKGNNAPAALRELRAALDGVEPGEASGREHDLTTVAGVLLVAAEARIALAEGRTVEALEIATLASVDERSIRAAVTAGTLAPVGPGRPMRFAADVAHQYLYARGVPGFAAAPPRVGPQ